MSSYDFKTLRPQAVPCVSIPIIFLFESSAPRAFQTRAIRPVSLHLTPTPEPTPRKKCVNVCGGCICGKYPIRRGEETGSIQNEFGAARGAHPRFLLARAIHGGEGSVSRACPIRDHSLAWAVPGNGVPRDWFHRRKPPGERESPGATDHQGHQF